MHLSVPKRRNPRLRPPQNQGVNVMRAFISVDHFQIHQMPCHAKFIADEDEDARRTHRASWHGWRRSASHTNRISSLMVLHNLGPHIIIGGRDWARWWDSLDQSPAAAYLIPTACPYQRIINTHQSKQPSKKGLTNESS